MSDAAIAYVETVTIKGSAREVLRVIAKLIPEGQTTTSFIGMQDLADRARLHRRTILRLLPELVDSGEITVFGGGPGRTARYTLVHLTGARPLVTTPLPLVGAAAPRRSPTPRTPLATGSLFDQPSAYDQTAINLRQMITGWLRVRVTFCRRYAHNLRQTITGWWSTPVTPATNDHRLALPLDVDDARARDVHTLKNVHTPAAPRAPVHPWHAWCGLVCVPTGLHQEFRRKGHEGAWLLAFYAETCAALPPGEKIHVNDFTFWRTALKAELASATPTGPRRRPDIPNSRPCPHQPPCQDPAACIDRTMAEWQPKKEQSG